jgi:hypothetical protein
MGFHSVIFLSGFVFSILLSCPVCCYVFNFIVSSH